MFPHSLEIDREQRAKHPYYLGAHAQNYFAVNEKERLCRTS